MKTIKKVEIIPIFIDLIPEKEFMEEGYIYISQQHETAIHLYLCGCGNESVMPINENGWSLLEKNGKISFTPSVGNYQFACKSHYIITNNVANFV